MARRPNIGRAELEILHYVHDHHPVTVRDVAEHVSKTKGHGRTTVLNVIARLSSKGYLTRKRVGGVYHYSPRVPKAQLLRSLVSDFVDKALGGSLSPFVAYLAEDARVSEKELEELKRIVSELEPQKKNGERSMPNE